MVDADALWQEATGSSTSGKPQTVDDMWSEATGTQPKPPPETSSGNSFLDATFGGPLADNLFNSGHLNRIAEAFGQAFTQAHGDTGINPELQNTLQKWGVFDDYKNGKANVLKQVNEAFFRPLVTAGVEGFAALSGATSAVDQFGRELARTGQQIQGEHPSTAGQVAGWVPGALGEMTSGAMEGWLPDGFISHLAQTHSSLIDARANGVIGESEATYMGTKPPTPEQEAGRNQAAAQRATPEPTVHSVARTLAPDTFTQYDALSAKRDLLRTQLNEAPPNHPDYLAKQAEIQQELDRVEGDESKFGKNKAQFVAKLRDQLDRTPKYEETPERAQLRQDLLETDSQMRDMAPDVATAYRMAGEQLGSRLEAPTEPVQPVSGVTRLYHGGENPTSGGSRWFTRSRDYAANYRGENTPVHYVDVPNDKLPEQFHGDLPNGIAPLSNIELSEEFAKQAKPERSSTTVAPKSTAIYDAEFKKLKGAGLTDERADANATVTQSLYETYARDWEGRLGTAEELYNRVSPDVVSTTGPEGIRGQSFFSKTARTIVRLFQTADASTYMHETAHVWLKMLDEDTQRPDAPANRALDMAMINKWLGREEGKPLTKAMHEKFAAGWEKYLMEGRAPSAELAQVFAKFKAWLTDIYTRLSNIKNTATGKGFNMSQDIRDVFARMLSNDPNYEGVTIAPEDVKPSTEEAPSVTGSKIENEDGSMSPVPEPTVKTSEEKPVTPSETVTYNQSNYIDKDGNFNWLHITSDADVQNAMRAFAETHGEFAESRRLGMTDQDRIDLAETFNISARNMNRNLKKLQKITADNPIPLAVRAEALKRMLVQNTQRIVDAANNNDPVATVMAAGAQVDIMRTFLALRTAWGQMGHVFQETRAEGLPPEALNELFQAGIGKTVEDVQAFMQRIRNLDTATKASAETKNFLNPSIGEMLEEYFKNNLISGPLTHLQYTIGNKILGFMQAGPETWAAAVVGDIREKITGEKAAPGERVHHGEAQAGMYAFLYGQQDGLKAMWDAAKAGQTLPLPGEELATTPFTATKSIPGLLGEAVRVPGRMVAAIHSADRTVNFLTAKAMFAYRMTVDAGFEPGSEAFNQHMAEIQNNPSEDLMKRARDYATEAALMGPAGDLTKRVLYFTNWQPKLLERTFLGRTKPLGFISPFVTVSGNIMRKVLMERTPFGFFSEDARGANGKLAQDIAIGRASVATAVFGSLAGMYLIGHVNPGPSSDYKQAALDRMTKGLPYSIRVGNMSYAFDRLGVWGLQLAIGTDIMHAIQMGAEQPDIQSGIEEAGSQLMYSLFHHMTQEGFLSGVSSTMKAVDEHERYGANWVKNFLTSGFLPYGIGMTQLSTQVDPYTRKAYTFMDAIKNRIPFASETLEPKIDIFGNPVPNKEFLGVYASQVSQDPMIQHFAQAGYAPAPVSKDIMGVQLTPEQYTDYATMSGQQLRALLGPTAFDLPGFDDMPIENKHDLVKSTVTQARSSAQAFMLQKYPEIMQKAVDTKKALNEGYIPK